MCSLSKYIRLVVPALCSEQRKFPNHVDYVSNKAPLCLGASDDMCPVRVYESEHEGLVTPMSPHVL